ncbi:hypothetical protein MKK50_16240 [Methylobacterium sp. J-043]|nr:hypothetical protein [Methylobacterium sp. J-043]
MYLPAHARPYDLADSARATPSGVIARLKGFLGMPTPPETPEEAAARRDRQRREAAAELDQIEADRNATLPGLAAAEVKARKRLDAVTPGYQQAVADFDRAQAVHSRRAHDFAYARELAVRRITAAADPVIEEFRQDLHRLLEANRLTPIERDLRQKQFDMRRQAYDVEEWSNLPSIAARRIAILAAINETDDLKADPNQADIRERLVKIVEALPDNTVLVKVADA